MEFSFKKDVSAPVEAVFAALSDFSAYERQALRRGAELRRIDSPQVQGVGATWDAGFMFRGKPRKLRLTITAFDAPDTLAVSGTSPSVNFDGAVHLTALSDDKTRMKIKLSIAPQSFAARLVVQSAKLARATTERRIEARLDELVRMIEARHTP